MSSFLKQRWQKMAMGIGVGIVASGLMVGCGHSPSAKSALPSTPSNGQFKDVNLSGTWEGVYHAYPYAMGLTVTIPPLSSQGYGEGELKFYPLKTPREYSAIPARSGSYKVAIQLSRETKSLVIKPGN